MVHAAGDRRQAIDTKHTDRTGSVSGSAEQLVVDSAICSVRAAMFTARSPIHSSSRIVSNSRCTCITRPTAASLPASSLISVRATVSDAASHSSPRWSSRSSIAR